MPYIQPEVIAKAKQKWCIVYSDQQNASSHKDNL